MDPKMTENFILDNSDEDDHNGRAPADVNFTPKEAQLFAYVFTEDLDITSVKRVVYQLDACYLESQIEPRRDMIMNVCAMLCDMMLSMNHGESWQASTCDCVSWPIQDARGIPNLPQSNNSGVWMLKWLQLDEHFKPNHVGQLQETNVHINTAVGLIMDPFNKEKLPLRQPLL
ncbi:hypothetical protein RIF29_03448 [Crotalaria pallida]|uniref:Uncharacterized protein n=1 Tax=Crotalaria pallida TaxID=3830 RepID=A0AAN9J0P4_CROPI